VLAKEIYDNDANTFALVRLAMHMLAPFLLILLQVCDRNVSFPGLRTQTVRL